MKRIPTTLIVALLALGLTATAVFAAAPKSENAPRVASGTQVVVADETAAAPSAPGTVDETPEAPDNDAPESEAPDGSPAAHPTNHGLVVSQAAQASTPPGCKNHGQYVSMVARGLIVPGAPAPVPAGSPAPDGSAAPASVCDVSVTPSAAPATGAATGASHKEAAKAKRALHRR